MKVLKRRIGLLPIKKNGAGFTLVEILVGLVVVVTIGSFIASVFFSTLRGANKSTAVTLVRQNGNYAITQVSRGIQNSQSFDSMYNGTDYVSTCVGTSPVAMQNVRVYDFTNTLVSYSCGSTGTGVYANGERLIDTTQVSVTNCSFSCTQRSLADPPTITLYFELTARNVRGDENSAMIPFQTSVVPRNYLK